MRNHGYQTATLSQLTTLISSGSTPLGGQSVYLTDGPVMLVRSQNVQMNRLDVSDVAYISDEIDSQMKRSVVRYDDVLLNITGASIGRVARFDRKDIRANVNQHVCIIRPKSNELNSRYLEYFLSSPQVQSDINNRYQHGGTRQALTFAQISEFEIPLPPLPEQKRIADILDKADAIRRKRQEALKIIQSSYRSLFLAMFGDPVENPRGLPSKCIADLATRISKGESPKWQGFDYQVNGVQFITSENVRWGYIDTTTPKFIPHAFHAKLERSQLAADDLLINLVGASVGRAALIPESELPANVNQAVAVVTLDRQMMLPSFLLHQMLNEKVQRVLLGNAVESARANVSLTNIRETMVLVPDMEEQQAWEKVVQNTANLEQTGRRALHTAEDLFNSLVQRAFKGSFDL